MSRSQPDRAALKELQVIPGVGAAVSRDLWALGIRSVDALRDRDPEALYRKLCDLHGTTIDRCMLYVFRCAVYYASEPEPEPALLKWWSWTDERMSSRRGRFTDRRNVIQAVPPLVGPNEWTNEQAG